MKKVTGDIIMLHNSTINDNHMMYDLWDMKPDWQIFLLFWTAFCPFPPKQPKKSNFGKLEKTPGDIIISHKCTKSNDNML